MDKYQLTALLKSHGGNHVYNNFLLTEDTWIFKKNFPKDPLEKYHEFKIKISQELNVSVKNIAIFGSAKFGFSLNPANGFREFNEKSDIDLVVVSRDAYAELWNAYYEWTRTIIGSGKVSYNEIAKSVFKHHVSVKSDELTGDQLKYFHTWVQKVDKLKLSLQTKFLLPEEINYRVYDDWKYVEHYYSDGLDKLI
ncbi:hypothetical protein [Pseudomonas sp. CNPSo 3701]|uniref:hypothetical protein n=1 Tax=Pseudomonas sp. CNPSo 3701 TaxID=3027943 RepID=UPI0023633D1C|nr:hypothetical protein [Pseudomonas sp. CNPSo 3701]MDD1509379.1 hypothetical protein [Pseudomonas sp. CNPSo 3701]